MSSDDPEKQKDDQMRIQAYFDTSMSLLRQLNTATPTDPMQFSNMAGSYCEPHVAHTDPENAYIQGRRESTSKPSPPTLPVPPVVTTASDGKHRRAPSVTSHLAAHLRNVNLSHVMMTDTGDSGESDYSSQEQEQCMSEVRRMCEILSVKSTTNTFLRPLNAQQWHSILVANTKQPFTQWGDISEVIQRSDKAEEEVARLRAAHIELRAAYDRAHLENEKAAHAIEGRARDRELLTRLHHMSSLSDRERARALECLQKASQELAYVQKQIVHEARVDPTRVTLDIPEELRSKEANDAYLEDLLQRAIGHSNTKQSAPKNIAPARRSDSGSPIKGPRLTKDHNRLLSMTKFTPSVATATVAVPNDQDASALLENISRYGPSEQYAERQVQNHYMQTMATKSGAPAGDSMIVEEQGNMQRNKGKGRDATRSVLGSEAPVAQTFRDASRPVTPAKRFQASSPESRQRRKMGSMPQLIELSSCDDEAMDNRIQDSGKEDVDRTNAPAGEVYASSARLNGRQLLIKNYFEQNPEELYEVQALREGETLEKRVYDMRVEFRLTMGHMTVAILSINAASDSTDAAAGLATPPAGSETAVSNLPATRGALILPFEMTKMDSVRPSTAADNQMGLGGSADATLHTASYYFGDISSTLQGMSNNYVLNAGVPTYPTTVCASHDGSSTRLDPSGNAETSALRDLSTLESFAPGTADSAVYRQQNVLRNIRRDLDRDWSELNPELYQKVARAKTVLGLINELQNRAHFLENQIQQYPHSQNEIFLKTARSEIEDCQIIVNVANLHHQNALSFIQEVTARRNNEGKEKAFLDLQPSGEHSERDKMSSRLQTPKDPNVVNLPSFLRELGVQKDRQTQGDPTDVPEDSLQHQRHLIREEMHPNDTSERHSRPASITGESQAMSEPSETRPVTVIDLTTRARRSPEDASVRVHTGTGAASSEIGRRLHILEENDALPSTDSEQQRQIEKYIEEVGDPTARVLPGVVNPMASLQSLPELEVQEGWAQRQQAALWNPQMQTLIVPSSDASSTSAPVSARGDSAQAASQQTQDWHTAIPPGLTPTQHTPLYRHMGPQHRAPPLLQAVAAGKHIEFPLPLSLQPETHIAHNQIPNTGASHDNDTYQGKIGKPSEGPGRGS